MKKEVTCEASPTAMPLPYKQNKDPKRLVHGHFFFLFGLTTKHVGYSSPTRDWAHAPCTGSRLNLWTTRRFLGRSLYSDTVPRWAWVFPSSQLKAPVLHFQTAFADLPSCGRHTNWITTLITWHLYFLQLFSVFDNSSRRKYMSFSWQFLNLCSDYTSSWYNNEPSSKRWSTFIQHLFTEHLLGAKHHIWLTRNLY